MIAKYISAIWGTIGPALGDHLWQSTLFAVAAGLLTLTLRKNRARARYGLWLAASLKFLIPFSFLIALGSHVLGSYAAWPRASDGMETGAYLAVDQFSQPFTQPAAPPIPSYMAPAPVHIFGNVSHLLPAILAAVWLCGFLAVLFVWCVRWRRMSAAMREAAPLDEGREAEILRRVERMAGIRKRIEIRLSRASLEPGIFGIARPVLVWPHRISERLDDAQVEAIVAHEVQHVRRHDNLAAATHMFVEAVFWFHPLVWWLGTRLVNERERACDEEALAWGRDREVYAESILKICEFCVESPLACVSGVTGADLKKRIVRIMTGGTGRKLGFSKKLFLGAAALGAIGAPVVFGLANAMPRQVQGQAQNAPAFGPEFKYDVASIKPGKSFTEYGGGLVPQPDGLNGTNVSLLDLIKFAYGIYQDYRILGAPAWINSTTYTFEAKMDSPVIDEYQKLSRDKRMLANGHMVQGLLADRFKLVVHRETKELPVYLLVVGKNGPKLQEAKPDPDGTYQPVWGGQFQGRTQISLGHQMTMDGLAGWLSGELNRTVLDKTGLTGHYEFTLRFVPPRREMAVAPGETSDTADGPPLLTAVQEQLGLKVVPGKGPTEVIVIDHVEPASPN